MLYRMGLRYSGGGLIVRPEAIYFLHQARREGRFLVPELTTLSLPKEAWQDGRPVYGEAAGMILKAWLSNRRGRPPRPLIGCLSSEAAYFGSLTMPVYEASEIAHQIRQVVPLRGELAWDCQSDQPEALPRQRVTYVATAQSEVSALARYFKNLGCPLAVLDVDVFALWRATALVMPALVKRPLFALLWIGARSALFAIYHENSVIGHLAWSHDQMLTLAEFVKTCAEKMAKQGLVVWGVCAANREGADVVISISREAGLSTTFLDLMPYGLGHEALANAYLAWGLALRGVSSA